MVRGWVEALATLPLLEVHLRVGLWITWGVAVAAPPMAVVGVTQPPKPEATPERWEHSSRGSCQNSCKPRCYLDPRQLITSLVADWVVVAEVEEPEMLGGQMAEGVVAAAAEPELYWCLLISSICLQLAEY